MHLLHKTLQSLTVALLVSVATARVLYTMDLSLCRQTELSPCQFLPESVVVLSRLAHSPTCLSTWVPLAELMAPLLALMVVLDTTLAD
jgi:hypothetical protein